MRDPDRIPRILRKLHLIWKAKPDMRLGQLIHNALTRPDTLGILPAIEDDCLEERLDDWLQRDVSPVDRLAALDDDIFVVRRD